MKAVYKTSELQHGQTLNSWGKPVTEIVYDFEKREFYLTTEMGVMIAKAEEIETT